MNKKNSDKDSSRNIVFGDQIHGDGFKNIKGNVYTRQKRPSKEGVEKWYQKPLGILILAILASAVFYFISKIFEKIF